MVRNSIRFSVAVVLIGVCAIAGAQPLAGSVDACGFQTSNGFVFRPNRWYPVLVSLRSLGSLPFSGELVLQGIDLDGDRVAYRRPNVTVTPGAGPDKRFWCYGTANTMGEMPGHVQVLNDEGLRVAELPLPIPQPLPLNGTDWLVLEISDAKLPALNTLQAPSWSPGQRSDGLRPYYRNVVIATLPRGALDLPDRWWGLEAVNVVVWDKPQPDTLSLAQREALIQWVRNGGQLVIGIGESWDALRASELAAILPLQGEGAPQSIDKLPVYSRRMSRVAGRERELRDPILVATAGLAEGAIRILGEFGPGNEPLNMISMRPVGCGRVVAAAAALRDITGAAFSDEKVLGALLDLNKYTEKFQKSDADSMQMTVFSDLPLFRDATAPIGFQTATAARGLLAFLFVLGYAIVATGLSWWWLQARGRTQMSWTIFALFAVVASVVSLATVRVLRGISDEVRVVTVLDLDAATPAAQGMAMFGFRSPTRQEVQLSLPGEGSFLRALARDPQKSTYYVTPSVYAGLPAQAMLEDVLIRATLKQFEGHWRGELPAGIRAHLIADRRSGELLPGSWIANDLDAEIQGGCVLYIDPRLDDGGQVPARVANWTGRYSTGGLVAPGLLDEAVSVPPAVNIIALRLPQIAAGAQLNAPGRAQFDKRARDLERFVVTGGERRRGSMPDLPTLHGEQQGWVGLGLGMREPVQALLLASTRNYLLHSKGDNYDIAATPPSTDGLMELDITHWLMRGQAVLVCWSSQPGPVRLHRDGRAIARHRGLTLYRLRVPLEYTGSPPSGGWTPDQEPPEGQKSPDTESKTLPGVVPGEGATP